MLHPYMIVIQKTDASLSQQCEESKFTLYIMHYCTNLTLRMFLLLYDVHADVLSLHTSLPVYSF
jgi:hypothetical protein